MTDLENGADCPFTGKDGRHLDSHVVTRAIGRAREAGARRLRIGARTICGVAGTPDF